MSLFDRQLAIGQLGESLIAQWLRQKGWNVLPTYEKEIDNGKGPRLFTASDNGNTQLISPDLFVMKQQTFMWIEAKHKTRFSWYGKGKYFVTGVDYCHFHDYCRVADATKLPVWLLFLHRESQTWAEDIQKRNAPRDCPVGLFGREITFLRENRSHFYPEDQPSMVYWQPVVHLHHLADLESIVRIQELELQTA